MHFAYFEEIFKTNDRGYTYADDTHEVPFHWDNVCVVYIRARMKIAVSNSKWDEKSQDSGFFLANPKTWQGRTEWTSPGQNFQTVGGTHVAKPGQNWKIWGWRYRWIKRKCCQTTCTAFENRNAGERLITFGLNDFDGDTDTNPAWKDEDFALPDPHEDWGEPGDPSSLRF